MLTLILAAQTPQPEAIWAKVQESYSKVEKLSLSFSTTWAGKKKPLYTGTLAFAKDKSLTFSFSDSFQGCRAGYKWTKSNGGSTWVSPASFRGYNDTLTPRHPYLLVDLLEAKADSPEWTPDVKSITQAKSPYWILKSTAGTTYTINAKTYRLTKYVGPELYDEERICTTTIK